MKRSPYGRGVQKSVWGGVVCAAHIMSVLYHALVYDIYIYIYYNVIHTRVDTHRRTKNGRARLAQRHRHNMPQPRYKNCRFIVLSSARFASTKYYFCTSHASQNTGVVHVFYVYIYCTVGRVV